MDNYSVLTTVYKNDNPAYLKQSIDSMLTQTKVTNDYVIVADGPLTEELQTVLDEYSSANSFFNVIRLRENGGLGKALRLGLIECKNELVARLDSDDISTPQRCELQLKEFEQDPELAVVGSDMYEFDVTPDKVKDIKRMPTTTQRIYEYGKRRNPFNHSSVMYKRSVILAVGNYSEMRRSQDIELWSKVIYNGFKTKNINEPLIYFRTDGSERIKRKRKWSNVKADLKVFEQNYKMGYAGFFDYIYVCMYQLAFFIMPEKMASFMYVKLFRRKYNQ